MEHKNSFHIKKLNHQSGDSWTKTMRAGYVWLAAILCFIWYAAGRFEMYMAGVLLFVGAAFLILLYLAGISAGKGFAIFISGLYFVVPFFLLSVENIRKALLIFSRTVADYLADYGQSKNIFHRILQNTSVDMQTGNVEFLPFVVNLMAHSSHGTVVESSSVHFVFCSSDLFRFSFFCVGNPTGVVCGIKLSYFLFLFIFILFLGWSTWNSSYYYCASFRNFFWNDEYRTDVGSTEKLE